MNYHYVASAKQPNAVTHGVVGHFTGPDNLDLIIAKCNRLELYNVTSEGLQPVYDVPIYAQISALCKYQPQGLNQEWLIVVTYACDLCILSFDCEKHQIVTQISANIQDNIGRPIDREPICIIDPSNNFLALYLYIGVLKIVLLPSSESNIVHSYNVRLLDINIKDICFLYPSSIPLLHTPSLSNSSPTYSKPSSLTLCVLSQDNHGTLYRNICILDPIKENLRKEFSYKIDDSRVSSLIPHSDGSLSIIGENTWQLIKGNTISRLSISLNGSIVWDKIDDSRYLVVDNEGYIYIFGYSMIPNNTTNSSSSLMTLSLGRTSSPSVARYIDNKCIYIGSSTGHSYIYRINDIEGTVEQINHYNNIGPLVSLYQPSRIDTLTKEEKKSNNEIICIGGTSNSGHITSIRNGTGFSIYTNITIPSDPIHIFNIDIETPLVIYSYLHHSIPQCCLYSNDSDEIPAEDLGIQMRHIFVSDFLYNEMSIYAGAINKHLWIQITSHSIHIYNDMSLLSSFPFTFSISAASLYHNILVLGSKTAVMTYLIEEETGGLREMNKKQLENEVKSVFINTQPLVEDAIYIAVHCFFEDTITLYNENLQPMDTIHIHPDSFPVSIFLGNYNNKYILLTGSSDGYVYTYIYLKDKRTWIEDRKISIGNIPVFLYCFTVPSSSLSSLSSSSLPSSVNTKVSTIFALSDKTANIYMENGGFLYSYIDMPSITTLCPLISPRGIFKGYLMASHETLFMGNLEGNERIHIYQSVIHKTPASIVYYPPQNIYAVITQSINFFEENLESNSICLYDSSFKLLYSLPFSNNIWGTALYCGPLGTKNEQVIIMGGTYILPDEEEPSHGFLCVYRVIKEGNKYSLQEIDKEEVDGCVNTICIYKKHLLCGVNGKLCIFTYENNHLELRCIRSQHVYILDIQIDEKNDYIYVLDLTKSVIIYTLNIDTYSITFLCNEVSTHYCTNFYIEDDNHIVCSDIDRNLFVLTLQEDEATTKKTLTMTSWFHLGDTINKIITGKFTSSSQLSSLYTSIDMNILFVTTSGRIGVIGKINNINEFNELKNIEKAILCVIKGIAHLSHTYYRSFKGLKYVKESAGFIDGDLIEMYLYLSEQDKHTVVDEYQKLITESPELKQYTVTSLTEYIETLNRQH
ncbi:hypothetical protein WA158_004975 [Blastocystis sp. Blastoise]